MFGALAEFERDLIRERTLAGSWRHVPEDELGGDRRA
jgi:DNA invertase Pin-like site-specific DNA recombinase